MCAVEKTISSPNKMLKVSRKNKSEWMKGAGGFQERQALGGRLNLKSLLSSHGLGL